MNLEDVELDFVTFVVYDAATEAVIYASTCRDDAMTVLDQFAADDDGEVPVLLRVAVGSLEDPTLVTPRLVRPRRRDSSLSPKPRRAATSPAEENEYD